MLDTARRVETPEGIELALEVAGPMPRAVAWTVDVFLRSILYFVIAMVAGVLGKFGLGLFLLTLFLMEWFYPVLGEMFMNGATPGKKMVGLRVIQDDGTPVGWGPSIIRNLVRSIDFLPLGYGVGLLCMLFNRDFKRLGDMAAGTLVVYAAAPKDVQTRGDARPAAPPWPLTPDEQQTLVNFAERRGQITPERAAELARAAGPLVSVEEDPAGQLEAYANWVAGEP
ncbi:MAG: RDD family protein [Pseudomonadota bacterium]